ncbi:DUF1565 domain-containing protein [Lignipirellula cremea]|uniref:DUF1565 domain-containing protein n=1 Tax=Lignipirellula cremea TaxID=2528010 RepID=A0A518DZV9_9BACT|nr:DUF1565 domain-containing protein [Lignipirellula cremea]QDU97373.1 hypothetical protein Pla8534_52190 [Lignipirellula cremea]
MKLSGYSVLFLVVAAVAWAVAMAPAVVEAKEYASHPPLRLNPPPSQRPRSAGPAYFVDASQGDDSQPGSEAQPWRTIQHALLQLKAGDTLYLRGGSYFENVAVRISGTAKKPIVIRSFPGEQAVIDGSLPEFQRDPAQAWEPYPAGGPGEFRSTTTYPNVRDIVGAFGDSDIGLQTYWHLQDLRAAEELSQRAAGEGQDVPPVYCGPGVYYDRATGRIHARLAPTHFRHFVNYAGVNDPRELPLVLAPFRSTPLYVDQGEHLKFQDLVIRGGGYETVIVESGVDVDFDNVTIRGGTYCLRTNNTQQLRFYASALYGNAPPWSFRGDGSLRNRPGRNLRDIARLTCHAVWTTDTGREFSVYAFPMNDDWEVAYSEFTDSHDGPYLGGISMRFHHNLVDNFQDDGIYLSQMYPRHLFAGSGAKIEIYENLFQRSLTPIAFGGMEDTRDDIYIFRNVFDLTGGVNYQRPSVDKPDTAPYVTLRALSDHGGPPWPEMKIYQNTFITQAASGQLGVTNAVREGHPRYVFNNLFHHQKALGAFTAVPPDRTQVDGNLYWSPGSEKASEAFFARYRKSPAFEEGKAYYAPGNGTHSLVADPQLIPTAGEKAGDYRLQPGSPAVNAGLALPKEWPDSRRSQDAGAPDIGAFPLKSAAPSYGRSAAQ